MYLHLRDVRVLDSLVIREVLQSLTRQRQSPQRFGNHKSILHIQEQMVTWYLVETPGVLHSSAHVQGAASQEHFDVDVSVLAVEGRCSVFFLRSDAIA